MPRFSREPAGPAGRLVNVRMTEREHADFRALCAGLGLSQSEVLRAALDCYVLNEAPARAAWAAIQGAGAGPANPGGRWR